MSTPNLDQLRAQLLAIPAADVRRNPTPTRFAVFDYEQLTAALALETHMNRLKGLGYGQANLDELIVAANAYAEANVVAQQLRSAFISPGSEDAINRARALRDRIVAACRFHLRRTPDMVLKLESLAVDTGLADLALDLQILGAIVEAHAPLFAREPGFDTAKVSADAAASAKEVRGAIGRRADTPEAMAAVELADRAFTYLDDLSDELRDALEYGWHDDPGEAAEAFKSIAPRRSRRRAVEG